MSKTDLSIVIISFNTKLITKNCIESIFESLSNSQLQYEIIVADNGSTDGTVEILKEIQKSRLRPSIIGTSARQAKFKIILNKKNVGFGKANNQAVNEAKSDYILFLNSDILVLDDAVAKLINFYKQNENLINFLGGKLLNKNLTPQPSCGPFYTLPVIFTALFLRGDYYGLTRYSPDRTREVDWISGACILTRKKYFNKLGGFDENIFMYMDEIDLLYRAKKNNYRVFFYPEAKFIHLGFASSGSKSKPVQQVFKGFLYLYKKHYSYLPLVLLKFMLKLKAIIALTIGKITRNQYLISTYEEAYRIISLD